MSPGVREHSHAAEAGLTDKGGSPPGRAEGGQLLHVQRRGRRRSHAPVRFLRPLVPHQVPRVFARARVAAPEQE